MPHFRLERLEDEILLYYPGLTKTIQLNQTAAIVWELCNGTQSIREIADALGDAYPDHAAGMPEDVEATVRRLAAEGAIEFTG
jgi:hypothetical protein